jgi:DNA-binding transcriptional regulator YiaG
VEKPINQRIKFLLESLSLSARDFSRAVGVPDNNTQNYLEPRFAQPKADYLEKVMLHFESINPTWLLTGKGDPFLPPTNENDLSTTNNQKFFRSQVIGKNKGTANQAKNINIAELETLKNQLLLAEKDIESLRNQLTMTNALLAAKEETITLLRSAFNRPN